MEHVVCVEVSAEHTTIKPLEPDYHSVGLVACNTQVMKSFD